MDRAKIDGVRVVPRRKIWDERGAVFHMLRRSDPEFVEFGEVYFSLIKPGAIKAWKLHLRMGLNLLVVSGSARLALVDGREKSATFGAVELLELNAEDCPLVIVPPGVWSGFQGTGGENSILANCATEPHDPSEVERREADDFRMPNCWEA